MLRIFIPVLLVAAGALPIAGQEPDSPAPPVFRSASDLVVLHVNVFDRKSAAVPQLPQSAFQVFDEGKAQQITFFNDTDVPVAAGLVVDNSSSMLTRRAMVSAGSQAFITSSHPEDELFTVIFNEHVRFGLQEPAVFTKSPAQVQASLVRHAPGGKTALYDAVIQALDRLQEATHQKRTLIVLSDGEDNASRHSEADMLNRARRSEALIYTISTVDFAHQDGNPGVLKRLAAQTGGVAFFPKSEKDTIRAFTEVAENIRRGYSIGYVPDRPGEDGEYRRVKVTVRVPGRALTVRGRDGYTAGNSANAK
jgi:Ca-activated chloride channel family protein